MTRHKREDRVWSAVAVITVVAALILAVLLVIA